MAGANFDRIARAYRWMEYLSFGRALERCRFAHLAAMQSARKALVLGDGDGRFTARLVTRNRSVQAVAVDSSPAMLALLAKRVRRAGAADRLAIVTGEAVAVFTIGCTDPGIPCSSFALEECSRATDACTALHPDDGFDLVVSHFFLDCLSTADVRQLVRAVRPRLAPGAAWVISEFATPAPWAAWIVRGLYGCFRLLAGVRAERLPAYAAVLREEGFLQTDETRLLRGLLVSSLWSLGNGEASGEQEKATTLPRATSHPAS